MSASPTTPPNITLHPYPSATTATNNNSGQATDPTLPQSTFNLNLPRRLLILPPTALFLGALIGISRGGARARLRFLAENAHRQPTTIQGWYFYTKTRNYRILFASLREGAKTGLTLGAATAVYVLTEEGVRTLRTRLEVDGVRGLVRGGDGDENSSRIEEGVDSQSRIKSKGTATETATGTATGRKSTEESKVAYEWLDGGIAGSVLGAVLSGFNRFPAPLFARTVFLGTTFGALEGCLRIVQEQVGRLKEEKDEEERRRRLLEEKEGAQADAEVSGGSVGEGEGGKSPIGVTRGRI